jgi:DNA-binding Lrp family transcriptional regulator
LGILIAGEKRYKLGLLFSLIPSNSVESGDYYKMAPRITDKDRQIILGSQFAADFPVTKLARLMSESEHTIRYTLQKVTENRKVFFTPLVNVHQLGMLDVAVYFSCSALTAKNRERLLSALCRDERVLWVAEVGGEFQYGVAYVAHHISELEEHLKRLDSLTNGSIVSKEVAVRTNVVVFRSKYLNPRLRPRPAAIPIGFQSFQTIDDVDRKILSGLCRLQFYSVSELARTIDVPESTVDVRIMKLRERGIFLGCMYRLDDEAFGVQSFRCLVYEKGASPKFRGSLEKFCESHPNITVLVRSVGHWDYELGVQVESPRRMVALTQELYEAFEGSVRTIRTVPVFETHRRTYFPFQD